MIDRLAQIIFGVGTVAIPLIVVSLASSHARALARTAGAAFTTPRTSRWLTLATIAASIGIAAVVWFFGTPSQKGGPTLAAIVTPLVVLGWFALRDVGGKVNALREVDTDIRQADFKSRRVGDYLTSGVRFAPIAVATIGLLLGAWRLTLVQPGRRLLIPVTFALAALIFAWLYDTWIKQEVLGGRIDGAKGSPHDLRRTVRRIFVWECVLAAGFAISSHLLLDANWSQHGLFTTLVIVPMGVLGTVGCALILSHEIVRTRYRTTPS